MKGKVEKRIRSRNRKSVWKEGNVKWKRRKRRLVG